MNAVECIKIGVGHDCGKRAGHFDSAPYPDRHTSANSIENHAGTLILAYRIRLSDGLRK